ncbi:type II toxin-antitoxin system VapC family toxin [Endozoicomonas ascidiicola]|uniref:type II toxin-antitoxin system VapC family toxin n=1 Tax=Endozoicomonas ascidiicola TaxID=1698521 RepID=UPI000830A49D|nr:type II toxin-antitoxin system VapC family toxin [Endozoicomonas ascidiicola]
MQALLLDTCVILDLLDRESHWHEWAKESFRELTKTHDAVINPIVFSELCAGMESPAAVLKLLGKLNINEQPLNHEALFLAAKAFIQYRRRGGQKTGVLPDFYIGAQAAVCQWPLISRDKGRYTSYFPSVNVIMSDKN